MHLYVFRRLSSVPFVKKHVPSRIIVLSGIVLWIIFYLGRVIGHNGTGVFAEILEFSGMTWLATLFLIFIPVLAVDIITLFGFLFKRTSPSLENKTTPLTPSRVRTS